MRGKAGLERHSTDVTGFVVTFLADNICMADRNFRKYVLIYSRSLYLVTVFHETYVV
jgi:hypothetical protein